MGFPWIYRRMGCALGLAVLVSACATAPENAATVTRQPSTAPVRTVSNFSEALRCMDTLLWTHGKRDIYITSNGVPDDTGRLQGGTKEMLITAISRMSEQSSAFSFIDFEPTQDSVNALYWMLGVRPEFRAPSYYIRGAVTQLDENVVASAANAGVSLPQIDLSGTKDQTVSVISVDLSVGELVTRRIIPGVTASNSIAVMQSGQSGEAGGLIQKSGLSFSVSLSRSEGMHQALRTLIELSTIEVLGKLTHVPYWQCLGIAQTDPAYMGQARDWYDALSPQERIATAQRRLVADGYYGAAMDGIDSPATRQAISRWQADHDLIPTGRADFDLYYRMLGAPAKAGATPVQDAVTAPAPPPAGPSSAAAPDLILSTDRGPQPSYRVGETLVVQAQPSTDGFLYCYYADANGSVARIFPNRFQPDAFVEADRQVEIPPGPPQPFTIRVDTAGTQESIACAISPHEVGMGLPDRFKTQDLQPIPQAGLTDVLNAFAALPNTVVTSKQLAITVLPATR